MAMKRVVLVLAVVALMVGVATAGDKKDKKNKDEKIGDIHVTILKSDSGKPVRNASVVLHPVNDKGRQEAGGLQLKTDAEGNADYNGIPYGKLRIQVIATGFQTYGQDYEINQQEQQITIKLQRPKDQYSIYK
jgi:uncharacterized GH25 family protein